MLSAKKSFSKESFSPALCSGDPPETRKKTTENSSCYFPGCRKDTNCHCEICIASINATLDLVPPGGGSSITRLRSSITKISSSSPSLAGQRRPRTHQRPPALPNSGSSEISDSGSSPASPPLHSTAKSRAPAKKPPIQKEKISTGPLFAPNRRLLTVLLASSLAILIAVCGSAALKEHLFDGAILTPEIIRTAGEQIQSNSVELRGKLVFVQNVLAELLGADKITNCSTGSGWRIHEGAQLLMAKCVIYCSAMEEVAVWGFPIQISGVISSGLSSRWLTVLSGRVTEWSPEKQGFGELRSEAYYGRWATAVVHLEEESWVLEYKASWLENWSDVIPRLWELLRARISSPWGVGYSKLYRGEEERDDVSLRVPS